MTKIHIEPKWSAVKPDGNYVYIHLRKSTREPFHVGMGVEWRGFSPHGRNPKWVNTARKNGVIVEIAQDCLSREDAFLLEMWLIAKLRHEGYNLCNLTDGGEGAISVEQSEESNIRRRDSMGGKQVFCSDGTIHISASAAAAHASRVSGTKCSAAGVSMCCKGKSSFYKALCWSYDGFPDPPTMTTAEVKASAVRRRMSVRVTNDFGEEFESMTIAVDFLRKNGYPKAVVNGISLSTRGKIKYAYGRVWARHERPKDIR